MTTKTRRRSPPKSGEGEPSLIDEEALRKSLVAAAPLAPAPEHTPPDGSDAPADPMPDSGMVCLLLDDATVAALDKAFPAPEGASIPAPRHITLSFLGPVDTLDRSSVEAAISAALNESDEEEDEEAGGEGVPEDMDTITGTFAGWARFAAESDDNGNEGGNLTPIVALFDSPDLEEIQTALSEALEDIGVPEPTHGFTSHSTCFRVKLADTDSIPIPAPPMLEATFSEIALVWGDYTDPANITMFPVAGTDEATEPEAPEEEPMMDEPATTAASFGATGGSVTDKPWNGDEARFTDEQYRRAAAACDPASKGTTKATCFLPHHEPGGVINRNGVHAAAGRLASLSGRSPDAVATAKAHLRSHYTKDLKEDPPDSLMSALTAGAPPPPDGVPVPQPEPEWEALIVTEGKPGTDDGRDVAPGALRWRPLPLSFTFQPIDSANSHDEAPVGGAITEIVRDGDMVMARGIYAQGPLGDTCRAMVDDPGMPLAPSIRMAEDSITAQLTMGPDGQHLTILDGLLLNFCLVPVEAQSSTWIRNLAPAMPLMPDMPMEPMMASACACDEGRDSWRFTGALIACAAGNGAPVHPPAEWFDFPPELAEGPPKALQITADGRIFGNLAGPGCHLAKPNQCLTVGVTSRDFTLFHHGGDDPDGGIVTAEGTRIRVGALTLSGGHAGLRASADEAMAHYDDPARVGAFLRAGWDTVHNLPYIAGAVLPRVSEEDLQVMRALGVSGDWRVKEDWRTIDGKRTLVGLALVPVPGWPVAWRQAIVASGVLESEVVDTFGALQADLAEPAPIPEPVVTSPAWILAAAADGMAAEVLRPEWEAEAASYAEVLGV